MKRTTCVLVALLCSCPVTFGQRLLKQDAPAETAPLQSVRVQQPIKPAFLISPLVQRLSARRGQLLRFEFEIESNLKATRLEISTVGMTQQENGVILPDPDAVSDNELKLLTPSVLDLAKGSKAIIRCQVRVPSNNSPFVTYGVLAKEVPLATENRADRDEPAVGVRFVTQYLLRTDIEVIGVRGDSVKQLRIESAQLSARNGKALVNLLINNPTQTAMEYQVRTQLVSNATRKAYSSRLFVPVRENQQEPDRFEARILPETKLRMLGVLKESVFPGSYTLKVELLYKGRVYTREQYPVEIRTGDFPAQDATIVRVSNEIIVEPSAIALSLQKGGSRIQSFTVRNGSQQKIIARIRPKANIGELADWLVFRPDNLELGPGQSRKVLATIGRKRDFKEHSYAWANIVVSPEVGQAIGSHDVPVALLTNSKSTAEIKAGQLAWKSTARTSGFEVTLQNKGNRHLELAGKLQLKDQFGRGFVLEDGYGRWVLPNQRDRLQFQLPRMPPPGTYNVRLEIQQGEGQPPLQVDQVIQLEPTLERVTDAGSEDVR